MYNKYGVNQIYYYYLRDTQGKPVVTVCVVRKDSYFARGVAICSKADQPVKKVGRTIARNRALWAIHNGKSKTLICSDAAIEAIDDVDASNIINQAEFGPDLTVFEKCLFGMIERNMN